MRIFATLALGFSVLMLSACSSKSSTAHNKHHKKSERAMSKKSSKDLRNSSYVASEHTCRLQQDQRRIVVDKWSAGGCEVNYEKNGGENKIAESRYGLTHCNQVRDRVLQNLQSAGFDCQTQVVDSERKGQLH